MLREEGNFSPHSGRWHGQNWTFPWCCLLLSPPGIMPSVYQQLSLWEYRTHIRNGTKKRHMKIFCARFYSYLAWICNIMKWSLAVTEHTAYFVYFTHYMFLNLLIIAAQLTVSKSHISNNVSVIIAKWFRHLNITGSVLTVSYFLPNKYGNWHKILIWVILTFLLCENTTLSPNYKFVIILH